MTEKEHNELKLRRKQMSSFPFCSDHRDKVQHLPCRECEIERVQKVNDLFREALIEVASGDIPEHVLHPRDGGEPPRYGWAVNLARDRKSVV